MLVCHWSLPSGFLSMKCNYSLSLMADDRKQFTLLAKEVFWLLFLWSIFINKNCPSSYNMIQKSSWFHGQVDFQRVFFRCKNSTHDVPTWQCRLPGADGCKDQQGERIWKGLEAIATCWISFCLNLIPIEFDIQLDFRLIRRILDFLIFPNLRLIGSPIEFHHFWWFLGPQIFEAHPLIYRVHVIFDICGTH